MGGRCKSEELYEYLWLIYVDIWQKPVQYCKAIILQKKIKKKKKYLTGESYIHLHHYVFAKAQACTFPILFLFKKYSTSLLPNKNLKQLMQYLSM